MLLAAYASDRYKVMFDEALYPVEVKEGPSGKLRSLHIYRETYKPSCSVVFHAGKAVIYSINNSSIVRLFCTREE